MLVNGQWSAAWTPYQSNNDNGEFVRENANFRHWVTADGAPGPTGDGGFRAEPGRYHLYVALICPWASRALMVRALKGLQDVISVSVVEPALSDKGWRFGNYPGATRDHLHNSQYLHQVYTRAKPKVSGRATVPVLWDKKRHTIVNNESADIIVMLNNSFEEWAKPGVDLRPEQHLDAMQALHTPLYEKLNNGVYRAGFAKSQQAYEHAVHDVFEMLETLDQRLAGKRFLMGDDFTESDVRLFVTLVRFDAAYHGLFKCNLKRIADYPNLSRYMLEVLRLPGVSDTVNLDHVKQGYYSVKALNPSGIVPVGPQNLAELPLKTGLAA